MKVNGVDIQKYFSVTLVDDIERAENALEKLGERFNDINNVSKRSEYFRKFCEYVNDFFNEIIGEEASKEVLGDKLDIKIYTTALTDFVEGMQNDDEEEFKELNIKLDKFNPSKVRK